mmetsp:Transcript_60589/g.126848  ORF Transcript_60589/g.126848 Transcript_60589/m.126848 type:complete len:209 (+) Transcript_60589:918-1544(+)
MFVYWITFPGMPRRIQPLQPRSYVRRCVADLCTHIRRQWICDGQHVCEVGGGQLGLVAPSVLLPVPGTLFPDGNVPQLCCGGVQFIDGSSVRNGHRDSAHSHPRELPTERDWRHLGTQLLHAPRCALQDHQDSARDTPRSLASTRTLPSHHGWLPSFQCHLHRAVLRLRQRMGASAVFTLRNPDARLPDSHHCDVIHHHRSDILPGGY